MKMTKDDLKAMIKECIVEVLNEGLGASMPSVQTESRRSQTTKAPQRNQNQQQRRFDPRLDTPVGLKEAIKKEAAGNPLMESIFSDTARTTLKEQASYGDSEGGQGRPGISQQEQFRGSPEEVFGDDVAANWASLAFGPSGKNKLDSSHT